MGKLVWTEELSMDSEVIDAHHGRLIHYINELDQGLVKGHADDRFLLMDVVEKLLDYTEYHFTAEEAYMEKYQYPELKAHSEEHEAFIDEIKRIKILIEKDSENVTTEILSYLKSWFLNHVQIIDKKYALFFKSKGIQLP